MTVQLPGIGYPFRIGRPHRVQGPVGMRVPVGIHLFGSAGAEIDKPNVIIGIRIRYVFTIVGPFRCEIKRVVWERIYPETLAVLVGGNQLVFATFIGKPSHTITFGRPHRGTVGYA